MTNKEKKAQRLANREQWVKDYESFYTVKEHNSKGGSTYLNLKKAHKRNAPMPIIKFVEKDGNLVLWPVGVA